MFSSAERCWSTLGFWKMIPISRRTALASRSRSWPPIVTVPLVLESVVVRIEIVVVLPAPLGPRKANSSPGWTCEADVVDRRHGRLAVALDEVLDVDHRVHGRGSKLGKWEHCCRYGYTVAGQGRLDVNVARGDPGSARMPDGAMWIGVWSGDGEVTGRSNQVLADRSWVTRQLGHPQLGHHQLSRRARDRPVHRSLRRSSGCASRTPLRKARREVDRIVQASIALADQEGPTWLSMRHLAAALATGTTSLYRYVKSKDELLELMVDAVNGESPGPGQPGPPVPSGDWRADLRLIARGRREQFLRASLAGRPGNEPPGPRPEHAPGGRVRQRRRGPADRLIRPWPARSSARSWASSTVPSPTSWASSRPSVGAASPRTEWRARLGPYVRSVIEGGELPEFRRGRDQGRGAGLRAAVRVRARPPARRD